ncbi:T9SS type A sorting domain-containing protein [Marinoscillum furvescens]|uniref:Putative secreted protein (Por secretion system target) n=1 Tax=Marinoscillum furvescens DSM 4134 TaxID=1122208 RepID=A0A3D9L3Y9_MARFU|nr:T9SS type A sorting domain-containing protein [Marinoscillum furvescens]REE00181.1 putative secreted protein (Por secretion system target) [Marinoscillum furvescens DSM 4134]
MKIFYSNRAMLLLCSILLSFTLSAQSIYTNNMDYVLGDVKQAFIQNKITTQAQADNLIVGFQNMQVNGIRIPIFADGHVPNKPMLDYFYDEAVAAGFKIFANPAQHAGGQRIACEMLNGTLCTVKGDTSKSNILINRIKDFATEYAVDWINPFNEDGKPGGAWTADQMNTIYASLYNNVGGAELIGPCPWGIPAAIDVFNQTNVPNYVTVATTHNLGFNHNDWSTFIGQAATHNLPVWDSEVNHYDKYGTGTRLEVALDAGVDGLVLYDSWKFISLTDGSISSTGQTFMDLYLKFVPDTNKTYYIECVGRSRRIAADGSSDLPYTTNLSTTGSDVEWKFVSAGTGLWHIERAGGGSKPRLRAGGGSDADMDPTSSSGGWTKWSIDRVNSTSTNYFLTLPYGPTNDRLHVNGANQVKMVTTTSTGSWVQFRFVEVSSGARTASVVPQKNNLKVYPNPVTDGVIYLSLPETEEQLVTSASLFTLDGRKVLDTNLTGGGQHQLHVAHQLKGLHLLRIQTGAETQELKVFLK